jgi:hypothetical protein
MQKIAEIIEANTNEFTAQCYKLYEQPPLGSLVKTVADELEIFGIVYNAATSSIEPGRRPLARGKDEPDEEAVYRTNPQLKKLLRSEFRTLVIGFKRDHDFKYYLPPNPARIHGFVYACQTVEIESFSNSLDFLNILLNTSLPVPVEEVTGAVLRQMSELHADPHHFRVEAGKELAKNLGNDFYKLKVILSKIQKE